MKKVLIGLLLIVILGIVGFIGYIYFKDSKNQDSFSVIPSDAIYIIETNNLTEAWAELSNSSMWKHLRINSYYEDLNKSADELDSLIKYDKTINMLLNNRRLLISAHMISGVEYDFLFVVDMEKISKLSFIIEYLEKIINHYGYDLNKRVYKTAQILELTDKETNEILYLAFIDNLLLASYNPIIIEDAIIQKDKNYWEKNDKFQQVAGEIGTSSLFNFYINYSQLNRFMKCYILEENDLINSLSTILMHSAFNITFENEELTFDGYTNYNDSLSSYIKALSQVGSGRMKAYEVISDQTAFYLAMCFSDFDDFYENLKKEFATENEEDYEDYSKKVNQIEKLFKISLSEDFFSWIGNEISFIKTRPTSNSTEKDIIVTIHAKDINDAKQGLTHITEQVRKRSPLKFKTVIYNNYEINYLDIKGFFKMFLGKLFGKLEKPYFTYIEDVVVFSNTPSLLMDVIDDYTNGRTLGNKKEFTEFKDKFNSKSNVTIFIQMPKLYSHLYFYSKEDKRAGIQKNKELVLSFAQLGFQLTSDGDLFETKLIARHFKEALYNDELEDFESAAEDLFKKDFESLGFKINLSRDELLKEGTSVSYYSDTVKKYEGLITEGMQEGSWKTYYESGNIMNTVTYKQGMIDGPATFYYDDDKNTKKAELNFEMEVITGTYVEYYKNGNQKAMLFYEDGKPNGEAEFYYDSGNIKVKGQYKNGEKQGKWKNYTETGELYEKQKFKKGNQK